MELREPGEQIPVLIGVPVDAVDDECQEAQGG